MAQLNHDTWEHLDAWREHTLKVAWCEACQLGIFPPHRTCPTCWSDAVTIVVAGAGARLVTFSVPRAKAGGDPAPTGIVELHDPPGVRMLVRLAISLDRVASGMELQLEWVDAEGGAVPVFAAAEGCA